MPSKIIQDLLKKGWTEEEVNQYLYYRFKDSEQKRQIRDKLSRVSFRLNLFLLIMTSIVFGLFFIIFLVFNIESAAILWIILIAGYIEFKVVQLFRKPVSLAFSVGLTTLIIVAILAVTNYSYASISSSKGIETNAMLSSYFIVFLLLGIAGSLFSGIFVKLLSSRERDQEYESEVEMDREIK
ncbi:MAG: hypothetical protein PWQ28_703 [Candidatus Woesearchaeota archaeon]|nr:hypothetical protein [Candidatus Woesearchaeota archaeon]MDK2908002.1 hypothetical protein [Candidatus Woesearchaeota archaeon]